MRRLLIREIKNATDNANPENVKVSSVAIRPMTRHIGVRIFGCFYFDQPVMSRNNMYRPNQNAYWST